MLGRKTLVAALIALVAAGGLGYSGYRVWRHFSAAGAAPTPKTAVVITAPTSTPDATAPTPVPTLPPSVFIKVPYTSEFPFASEINAHDPHENYCEAAALEMVSQYFKGDARDILPAAEADAGMGSIVSVERRSFPGVLDLPLTSVAAVGTQMFGLKPTIAPVDLGEIQRNLAAGRPVIVPVMTWVGGARISEHYGNVGVYHVVVLIGYDSARGTLYTNESGFTQGRSWPYSWSLLSAAIDAQAAKFPQGRVMLVFDRA